MPREAAAGSLREASCFAWPAAVLGRSYVMTRVLLGIVALLTVALVVQGLVDSAVAAWAAVAQSGSGAMGDRAERLWLLVQPRKRPTRESTPCSQQHRRATTPHPRRRPGDRRKGLAGTRPKAPARPFQRSPQPQRPSRSAAGKRLAQIAHSPSPRCTTNGELLDQSMNWSIVSRPNSAGSARSRTSSSNAVAPTRSANSLKTSPCSRRPS